MFWVGNQLFMVFFTIFRCFYDFPLIFKVFINIYEYANYVIGSSGDEMKGTCITFNLLTYIVYDKYQVRYD